MYIVLSVLSSSSYFLSGHEAFMSLGFVGYPFLSHGTNHFSAFFAYGYNIQSCLISRKLSSLLIFQYYRRVLTPVLEHCMMEHMVSKYLHRLGITGVPIITPGPGYPFLVALYDTNVLRCVYSYSPYHMGLRNIR